MVIRSRLDNKEIEINVEENKKYGIMISGGLDSAVLLYLILLDAKLKNINLDITPFTITKTDGSYLYVDPIIDYLNNLLKTNIPYTTLIGDPNTPHDQHGINARIEVKKRCPNIDHMFSALTQNPPFTLKCVEDFGWTAPNRLTKPPNSYEIMPFLNLYKSYIIDFADQYNLHKLFEITHSCTEKTNTRCGICFQCEEREWAFRELNLLDTGKI